MSAEILRRAAALMRERAEAIDASAPWYGDPRFGGLARAEQMLGERADAEHIASWHPAVALAVADWLDAAYDDERRFAAEGAVGFLGENPAFAVARSYLGEFA